jgi:hypothetical protein
MTRRRTNPRFAFTSGRRLKRHAKVASRWSRRQVRGSEAPTARYTRSNCGNPKRGKKSRRHSIGVRRKQERRFAVVHGPVRSGSNKKAWMRLSRHGRGGFSRSNPSLLEQVRTAAAELKRRHGGQAYGWAADQASMAPRGEKQRFWQQVTQLLRRELYAMNPGRKNPGHYPGVMAICPHCNRPRADGSSIEHAAEGERLNKRLCYRSEFGHDRNCTSIARRSRSNPKRDGSPTRGEMRKDKYKDRLRQIRDRGQKAADELNKLLGRGAAASVGHAEPALRAPKTDTQLAHPGHFAAEESSEQKFAREQIANINALMGDLRDQLRELGDDESLADGLSEQLVKLGKQKKALQDVAGQVMTNPRRYTSPARYRRMSVAQRARYRNALRMLRSSIRSL